MSIDDRPRRNPAWSAGYHWVILVWLTVGWPLALAHAGPAGLVVDQSGPLGGTAGLTISYSSGGSTVTVLADDVVLENLQISGSGTDLLALDAGIRVLGNNCTITNCTINGSLFGIVAEDVTGLTISNTTIVGDPDTPMAQKGSGIQLNSVTDALIKDNRITAMRDGIYFDDCIGCSAESNEISNLRYAIHFMFCGANEFNNNQLNDNVSGAAIMYSDGVDFHDNLISTNRAAYMSFGLLLKEAVNCTGTGNLLLNNVTGVLADTSTNNQLSGNVIAFNDTAVKQSGLLEGNLLTGNDFLDNTSLLVTETDTGVEWIGNYYSGYPGYDAAGDGTGDLPARLQSPVERVMNRHQAAALYTGSPAATVLTEMESSFPVLSSMEWIDPTPASRPVAGAVLPASLAVGSESMVPPTAVAVLFLIVSAGLYRRLVV